MGVDDGSARPALWTRAIDILIRPRRTWEQIAAEPTTAGGLMMGYVAILAALPVLARLIGAVAFQHHPLGHAALVAAAGYGLALAAVVLMGFTIEFLAPLFGAERDRSQAFKAAAYPYTAAWVVGILGIWQPLVLLVPFAGVYGVVLLWLGLPRVMRCPKEKAVAYNLVAILAAVALAIVSALIMRPLSAAPLPDAASIGRAALDPGKGPPVSVPAANGGAIDMNRMQQTADALAANTTAPSADARPASVQAANTQAR
jgi:hypothetical protein